MEALPPLRRLHGDRIFLVRRYRLSLEFWRSQTTECIVASLRRRRAEPSCQEYLKVRPDGTVYQGNTRVKVLEERGYDLALLPRYPSGS